MKTCFGTAFDFLSFSYKACLRGMRRFHEKLVHKVWEIESGQEIAEGISVETCVEEAGKAF